MPIHYTPNEAAPLLSLTPDTVRSHIYHGLIAAIKRGGRYFIAQEEIDRYNRERRKPGLPGVPRQHSPEAIEKMRQARLKNNHRKGTKATPETLAKMQAAQSKQPRGAAHWAWKGGRPHDKNGYVLVYMPNHPAAVGRYVLEHRLVMEQVLGRYLEAHEEVHHKNEIVSDNRPENLQVMTKSAHSSHHRSRKPNLPRIRARRSS